MKSAALLALASATAAAAAATAPAAATFLPALMIEDVELTDPDHYVRLIGQANTAMREAHAVPLFLRLYATTSITGQHRRFFTLCPSGSFATLLANRAAFASDPALSLLHDELNALAQPGPAVMLKAVRFDGTFTPGWLNNFYVSTSNEAALVSRAAELTQLLTPAHATFAKPHLNVFRVVAGEPHYTHLVSVNASSAAHLADVLDRLAAAGWTLTSNDPAAPCAVVHNTLYEELLP